MTFLGGFEFLRPLGGTCGITGSPVRFTASPATLRSSRWPYAQQDPKPSTKLRSFCWLWPPSCMDGFFDGFWWFLMVFVTKPLGFSRFFGCDFFREETEKILKIFWDLFSISYISCFPQSMSGHPPLRNPGGSQLWCLERWQRQVAAEDLGIFGANGWRVFPFHSSHLGWAHLSALGSSTDLWAVLRLRRLVQVEVSTGAALCGTRRGDRGKWGLAMRNEQHRRILTDIALHGFTWTSAGLIGGFTYCHVQPYLRRWSLRILKE